MTVNADRARPAIRGENRAMKPESSTFAVTWVPLFHFALLVS